MTARSAQQLAEYGRRHVTHGISRISSLVIERASGSWVYTVDGKKYLDFTTGIGVVSTGHCHPKVVKAVQEQAANLHHAQVNVAFHKPMLDLIGKLKPIMPSPELDSFFFANSGSEAVEAAIKVARYATKKQNVIVFQGSFHGRTIGAMSLTTSKTIYKTGFGPLMSGVHVAPFPYCLKCPAHYAAPDVYSIANCCNNSIDQVELVLKQQTAPQDTAAILIEPVLGEGGYVPPPNDFFKKLRDLCDRNNILLIADEVQSGFGRTGKMFAIEHYGVVPDIQVMAKGIASGFPLSAIVSKKELMDLQLPGSMGGTYTGNAVACAAAKATIEVFEEENIIDNVNERSTQIFSLLKSKLPSLIPSSMSVDIRGLGLMIGIEFINAPSGFVNAVMKEALEKHQLLLLTTSIYECIRLVPPLNISAEEAEDGVNRFLKAVESVAANKSN
ncbi:10919_t:CDS:2 [Paraglomus brasilianum]|uniref:10919_t:CDS:1 n=1 Tax=Paraglomus brasilianum TaxID=144538 RepID=A0A9N8WBE9_9GLOM|nr:10919_t:CDS:2 [Paraglomus brasilianum]